MLVLRGQTLSSVMASLCDFSRSEQKEGIEGLARTAGLLDLQVVVEFAPGCDVFVSSPTGFGKILIFGLLPVVIK